jgi:protein-tyrosine phosphatase
MYQKLSEAIKNHYGSKRGMLNYYKYQLLLKLGFYNKYKKVDFTKVKRLVFVCSGNICRSPFAEVVAKANSFEALSIGLHCKGGAKADFRAIDIAKKYGYELEGHRAANIKDYTYIEGDVILGMEPSHVLELERLGFAPEKISMIGLWGSRPKAYIHDPYNASDVFFNYCELEVMDGVKKIVSQLG